MLSIVSGKIHHNYNFYGLLSISLDNVFTVFLNHFKDKRSTDSQRNEIKVNLMPIDNN